MRHDNDVRRSRSGIRAQALRLVRDHLTNPRRAAALGLAAAVGTGALMFTAAAQPSDAASTTPAAAAITTNGGHDRAATITATKPVTIKTAKAAKAATAAAQSNAALNTTPVAGLDRTQMKNAALIVQAGKEMGISERGQIVAVSTAMQESNLYNRASHVVPESLKYDHQGTGADYDSVGLFQQRYTTGWGTVKSIMDPKQSAGKFYDRLQDVDGWESMPVTVAAQTVQGSAFPDAYAKHQGNATTVVHAINQSAAGH